MAVDLKNFIQPYKDALTQAIKNENWHLVLMAACTLPDICINLEGKSGGTNYIKWFDTFVERYSITFKVRKNFDPQKDKKVEFVNRFSPEDFDEVKHTFFSGVNSYALRCAYLHSGNGEVALQPVYGKVKYQDFLSGISKVKFNTKDSDMVFDSAGDTGILNPKYYAESILRGIDKWVDKNKDDVNVLKRASNLLIFE